MNHKKQNTMRKNAMKIIYTSAILIIVIIGMSIMSSCERPKKHKTTTTEVDEDTKEELIKVECLRKGTLKYGVYKVTIDYTTYVVVIDNNGVAIIKHNVRPR